MLKFAVLFSFSLLWNLAQAKAESAEVANPVAPKAAAPCTINTKSDVIIANISRSISTFEERLKALQTPKATDPKEIRLSKELEARRLSVSFCEGLKSMTALIESEEKFVDSQHNCSKETVAGYKSHLEAQKIKVQEASAKRNCADAKPDEVAEIRKILGAAYAAIKSYNAEWEKNPATLEEAGFPKVDPKFKVRYEPGNGVDFVVTVSEGNETLSIDQYKRVTGNK